MDKISIIIPVYNGEKYLARCVESLISQTYKNLEIIFLNDGSTDDSLNILKKYKTKDNRIVIVDKKNTGVSDTRNIGITRATGKYICFCDCDDLYETNYVETMYKTAKKHDVDIVKCNYQVIDTRPGSNPRYLIILSGEANESLPQEGSPCDTSDALRRCSRSWMSMSWSQ